MRTCAGATPRPTDASAARLPTTCAPGSPQARGVEQQRLWFDVLYLDPAPVPAIGPTSTWTALGSAYAEPASPHDDPAILAMVRAHEGDDVGGIARHWLARQPQAFLVFRDRAMASSSASWRT